MDCAGGVYWRVALRTLLSRITEMAAGGASTEANKPVPNNIVRAATCDKIPDFVACPASAALVSS
eukprot:scaffold36436_cov176-Amphora_coffeaeformis.AAC.8